MPQFSPFSPHRTSAHTTRGAAETVSDAPVTSRPLGDHTLPRVCVGGGGGKGEGGGVGGGRGVRGERERSKGMRGGGDGEGEGKEGG